VLGFAQIHLDRALEASLNANPLIPRRPRRRSRRPLAAALFLAVFALSPAAHPPRPAGAAERDWKDFPSLVTIAFEGGTMRARTGPDSSGQVLAVTFDPEEKRWSRPVVQAAPPEGERLDQVLVFNGGLFDQFPRERIDLGGGFTLARSDTGFALFDQDENRGWPIVTEDDVDRWGKEVRLGLPRDYPEDQLRTLLYQGRLRNVPGPFVRLGNVLWFGLAGGFAGSEGQLGGLVAYDVAEKTFRVVRHKFIADVAVTRLLAVGDELWIGTGRFAPSRLEGLRGMLLYRPKRSEWRQFAPENARISGDLVYDATSSGRHVWVTTNQGISRYDLERRLWSSWYWHPADDGPGHELTRERPVDLAGEFD
jgi:hypothetical protein